MEIVMRLHKEYRRAGRPHVVAFTPDPICWTEVPSDLRTLRRQRNRWHRGLWTNLWRHRDMLLNPRYGRLGLLAVPYFWAFEGLGPIVEVAGYGMLVVSAATGALNVSFALLFLALAVLYGVLLSQIGVGVEAFLLQRYPRVSDRLALFAAAVLESVGFRQLLALERFAATFRVGRREWGEMRRVGIPAEGGPAG
jgi:cellulose synthase/poly-beta-1,6-N-acetylglucosamine synthase-like glycosyltransferase